MGFREYVERIAATGADRLFPDWESPKRTGDFDRDDAAWSNGRVIRAFNRTVIPAVLKDHLVDGARRAVTFHSLRGSLKSMLTHDGRNVNLNVINEVIGHAKSEMDQSYVGSIPISKTYPAIRSCRYEGLTLPSAP
ncbi:hypothetical protein EON79_22095 [bacterium]|nr:MAG: hypothetical protein EON79_22095 [bacterium]